MPSSHHIQRTLQLQEAAAQFVSEQSNRTSLITVTQAVLSKREDTVTFYVSVFPETAQDQALGFLMRNRGTCKGHLKDVLVSGKIPHVEFALDEGERNRRRVDELLHE